MTINMRKSLREVAKFVAANPRGEPVLLDAGDVYDHLPFHVRINPMVAEIASCMIGATHHVRVHDDDGDFVAKSHDMSETSAHDLAHSTVRENPTYSAHCMDHNGDCRASYFGGAHPKADTKENAALYREDHDYASPTKQHWETPAPTKPSGKNSAPHGFGHGKIPDETALHRDQKGGVNNRKSGGGQAPQGGYDGGVPASFQAHPLSVPKPRVGPFADPRLNDRPDPRAARVKSPEDVYASSVKGQDADGSWDFSGVSDEDLEREMTRRRRGNDVRS
jgi:hypothetical protein